MNVGVLVLALMFAAPVHTETIEWASPEQEAAFRYGPFPQVCSGGWGAGKTWAYCMKALWLSDTFPRNRGVVFRRIAKELRATTMATFYKLCHPSAYDPRFGGRRNDQEGYCRLAGSGSEILFIHLDDPNIEGIIKGLEINWFLGDQAEENPEQMEEIFDLLLGRLGRWDQCDVPQWLIEDEAAAGRPWKYFYPKSGKPAPPPYAMLACNPDIELHWIYRRFHPESLEHQATFKAQGYRMFDFDSERNRFLTDVNRQYLLAHDDAFVRRNVRGIWGMPEGAIHAIDKRSLVKGSLKLLDYFRNACTLHRTLDHGDTSPTCGLWWAVDRDGNVFCFREYYAPNQLISTHRREITALSEGERYELNHADPSIFGKTLHKVGDDVVSQRHSVADEYADVVSQPRSTALFWQPADNNELGTRNRINEYLQVDPDRIHPITKTRGSPRLFFVQASDQYPQGCLHVLRETRSQRRVKIGTDLGKPIFSDERDPDIIDHAYDPLRYFIASRAPVFMDPTVKAGAGSFFGHQQRLAQWQARQMGLRR